VKNHLITRSVSKSLDLVKNHPSWHQWCLHSTVTYGKTPTAITFFKSEPLLPCDCYAIKTNIRTIRSQVLQPASAGNGADLVNCKLITAEPRNSEPCLSYSVIQCSKERSFDINLSIWLTKSVCVVYCERGSDRPLVVIDACYAFTVRKQFSITMFAVILCK